MNSAASAMAVARDPKRYGILGLRGKLINCLSNTEEDIYNNEEIKLLLSAMNIIPGKYDSSKLRYGKIAIAVDGDSDGSHIALLITAAIHYLFPEFLREGRLHWLRAPLYMIKKKNGNLFYYSDEEFSNAGIKGETSRFKGLGALSEDAARESMFGESQRMEQLIPDEDSVELLESLMGKDVQPRRDFVFSEIDFSEVRE